MSQAVISKNISRMTVAAAMDDFLTTMRKSPKTVATYGYGLRKFAAFLASEGFDTDTTAVTELTTTHVVDFAASLLPRERQTREDVAATRTAQTYTAAVRKFYKHLVANDYHPALSLEKMGLQLAGQQTGFTAPPPDIRTRDLNRILDFLARQPKEEKPESDLRRLKVAALVRFLYRSGTRVSECCAMRRGDIDLEDGTAFVFRGKGGKSRRVYFDNETAAALLRYWTARLDGSQPVALATLPAFSGRDLPGKPGNRITPRSVERIVGDVARQAGIPAHITPHSFRHGLATQLVEGKVPAPVVQRVLGHANLATTQVYVHLVDAEVRAEYQEAFGTYRPASDDQSLR
ncbi:MAG: tyrosine-type recombinase/integrase [Thermomicrobia bacterium]|nr:tyrosine-type recombinase/integrase [Thermomicrobia bacterium]